MHRGLRRRWAMARNPGRLIVNGANVVGSNLRIVRGAHLVLEPRASVGEGVTVMARVTCGSATMISGNVGFVGRDHPYRGVSGLLRDHPSEFPTDITVGADCLIGYGAILVGPVWVGHGAVVGAGSVVTRDVPPYAVVAGNPAVQVAARNV